MSYRTTPLSAEWKAAVCRMKNIDQRSLKEWLASMEKELGAVKKLHSQFHADPLKSRSLADAAASWISNDFQPAEARAWIVGCGCTDSQAARFLRAEGFTPAQCAVQVTLEPGAAPMTVGRALAYSALPLKQAKEAVAVPLIAASLRRINMAEHRMDDQPDAFFQKIALSWHRKGFSPSEVEEWVSKARVAQADTASQFLHCGISARQAAKRTNEASPNERDLGDTIGHKVELGLLTARAAVSMIHDRAVQRYSEAIAVILDEIEEGKPIRLTGYALRERAVEWAKIGFTPKEVLAWAGGGENGAGCSVPREAERLRALGITPEEASNVTMIYSDGGRDKIGAKAANGLLAGSLVREAVAPVRGAAFYWQSNNPHPDIADVLTRLQSVNDFIGDESPGWCADRWADAGFRAGDVAKWAERARCFKPLAAANLRLEKITPEQAGQRVEIDPVPAKSGVLLVAEDYEGSPREMRYDNLASALSFARECTTQGDSFEWSSWAIWANERESEKWISVADSDAARALDPNADPTDPKLCMRTYGWLHAAGELSTQDVVRIVGARTEREAQAASASYLPVTEELSSEQSLSQ